MLEHIPAQTPKTTQIRGGFVQNLQYAWPPPWSSSTLPGLQVHRECKMCSSSPWSKGRAQRAQREIDSPSHAPLPDWLHHPHTRPGRFHFYHCIYRPVQSQLQEEPATEYRTKYFRTTFKEVKDRQALNFKETFRLLETSSTNKLLPTHFPLLQMLLQPKYKHDLYSQCDSLLLQFTK